jgi:hypothetical protein
VKDYLTLEEIKDALAHPSKLYVPFVPLFITSPPKDGNKN